MRHLIYAAALLGLSSAAQAMPRTLPFIFETAPSDPASYPPKVLESVGPDGPLSRGRPAANTGVAFVDPEKVSDIVTTMRDSVCSKIGKGNVRVWLKFNAAAQVIGIGASSEGGIEVTIICG